VVSREQRRAIVCMLKGLKVSERRSCQFAGISSTAVRYQSRKQDAELVERLKTIAREHPRYG
jgi:hypothetical protein